ncbi:restriction endonuclease subunit S [Peribacillus frigoritolerans]|uniref:restriction endonuclease subunit S n=1 Tax=Peribacillus frigoritolerans TaxID=450367 RepID=UPI003806F0FE
MAGKDKKPEIRFTGFTDTWEQRRLGDIYQFNYGQFNNNPDNGGEYPIYGANGVIGGYHEYNAEDSIVIGHMGAYAGHVLWASGKHFVTYNGTIGFPKIMDFDRKFGYHMLQHLNIPKITAGSGQPFVSYADLESIKINIPINIKEQTSIGKMLDQLDKLITLHQRKYDKLVIVKKSMFEKMFPKDGADVPEIRFVGFNDAWEQRKLGEITDRVQGNDGRMDLPTLTISAARGWLDQRDRFYGNIAGNEQKNYTLLSKGDLSYNHGNSKLAKYGAVFELTNYEEALVPRVYHSFRVKEDTDSSFIEYLFATKLPDKELGKLISSGARMDGLLNISYDDFMGITVKTPQKAEQAKIGAFFRKLDYLIALHLRELEKLKNVKKSLLEKMFV